MNWYRKASNKTIAQAEMWIEKYAKTHNGKECLIHGDCDMFADDFRTYLNDPSTEIWSLWELYNPWHKKFPFVIENAAETTKIIGKNRTLSDIGFEAHIVVKWQGFFWDGFGKQTIQQIMKNFDKIPNPHWFRLE